MIRNAISDHRLASCFGLACALARGAEAVAGVAGTALYQDRGRGRVADVGHAGGD